MNTHFLKAALVAAAATLTLGSVHAQTAASERTEQRADNRDSRQDNHADRRDNRQDNRLERRDVPAATAEKRDARSDNRTDRRDGRTDARGERRVERKD